MMEVANWFEELAPTRVINIVNGLARPPEAALVAHPAWTNRFYGSAAVGKIIVKSAADTLKRVTLELAASHPTFFRRAIGSRR